jgi:hypothetical protein
MEQRSTEFINLSKAVLAVMFVVVVWRAATLPITPAEALAWDRVVRPGAASLLVTAGDWSGFLYGLAAKRAAGLFRLSEFSLRFPGILGCLLFCYAMPRLRLHPVWLLFAFAGPAILLNWFNVASGLGLSIGLSALALAHPASAGISLGLAAAAYPQIGFVPAAVAACFVYTEGFWRGVERVILPAVAIGFVLLIVPLSHGGSPLPKPVQPTDRDAAVRAAVVRLRSAAGQGTARIATSPSAASLLDFYRARYRQRNWLPGGPDAEYFLWVAPDSPIPGPSRQILFRHNGVVLAR